MKDVYSATNDINEIFIIHVVLITRKTQYI